MCFLFYEHKDKFTRHQTQLTRICTGAKVQVEGRRTEEPQRQLLVQVRSTARRFSVIRFIYLFMVTNCSVNLITELYLVSGGAWASFVCRNPPDTDSDSDPLGQLISRLYTKSFLLVRPQHLYLYLQMEMKPEPFPQRRHTQ